MLQPDNVYLGVDVSNWQGEMSRADAEALYADGNRFAIVRLSEESGAMHELAAHQVYALRSGGLAVLGYLWAYFQADPAESGYAAAAAADATGVNIVAIDVEDAPPSNVEPVEWIVQCVGALIARGIIPIVYTYPEWWASREVNFRALGDVRWWVAQWGGVGDLWVAKPYTGARIVGHQFTNRYQIAGRTLDRNAFRFDTQMLGGLGMEPNPGLTADEVRVIVHEELNAIASELQQGDSFPDMLGGIVGRIRAAGDALDLDKPVAAPAFAGHHMDPNTAGPAEAYPGS